MTVFKGPYGPFFIRRAVDPGRDLRIKDYTGMFFPVGWCDTGGSVTGQGMNKYPGEW